MKSTPSKVNIFVALELKAMQYHLTFWIFLNIAANPKQNMILYHDEYLEKARVRPPWRCNEAFPPVRTKIESCLTGYRFAKRVKIAWRYDYQQRKGGSHKEKKQKSTVKFSKKPSSYSLPSQLISGGSATVGENLNVCPSCGWTTKLGKKTF